MHYDFTETMIMTQFTLPYAKNLRYTDRHIMHIDIGPYSTTESMSFKLNKAEKSNREERDLEYNIFFSLIKREPGALPEMII